MFFARSAAHSVDLLGYLLQRTGDEDLVRRTDVGTPVDMQTGLVQAAIGFVGIEHHHQAVQVRGEALQAPAGGDLQGLADAIERHPVARGQGLDAGDAGDHLVVEVQPAFAPDRRQDAQGAVVQRRIAPDQEGAAFVVRQLVLDHLHHQRLLGGVEVVHRLAIVAFAAALGDGRGDEPIVRLADVAGADGFAQVDQAVLFRALVEQEEGTGAIEGGDGLEGEVVGIASADADDQQGFHGVASKERAAPSVTGDVFSVETRAIVMLVSTGLPAARQGWTGSRRTGA
ncbi:hypothetical protein BGI51_14030 [Pseudomonas oryzihabitans]|nr:hypothetical protein BGI51_14030 [Pseudomonas psychrotolerans]